MACGIPLPCISARCAAAQPIAHELLAKLNEFLSPASGSAKGINYWVNNLTHGTGSITLDPGVPCPVPVHIWEGEPRIGADVVGLSPAPVQMWEGGCITLDP